MKKSYRNAIYIIIGVGLLYVLLQVILAGYKLSWTGFGEYTLTNDKTVQAKKLWDWMQLLIIPFVLAAGAFFLNRSERAIERQTANDRAELDREIAKDRQQEAALQTYLDRMSELLIDKELRKPEKEEERNVARTRTLTVLRGLDGNRKAQVIQFLYEANLIGNLNVIVDLKGADLKAANLEHANLQDANLKRANLKAANLEHANLPAANLEETNLPAANLEHANLVSADLGGAILLSADLRFVNLEGAKLEGAYYEKSTKWPDGYDPIAEGAILVR